MKNIRSYSWGQANISWSNVIEELLHSAEKQGHKPYLLSTNGYKGMKYWNAARGIDSSQQHRTFTKNGWVFDIDLTYTVPQNFPDRFLASSKSKMAIFAYESSIMPQRWSQFYHHVDWILPPSKYCAEMIRKNQCPEEKIRVVPHGVDTSVFNPSVEPVELNTEKKFKFFCLSEPHYRKQLHKLLPLFCEHFTAKDDVSLVLKTKIFSTHELLADKKEHEIDLRPVLMELKKKHGENMPEIKIIGHRLKNIAALYRACDAFVLMTASEGWCVPYLEALACGIPVIAPRHGGQLEFLNDSNAVLTKCGVRRAELSELYWGGDPKGLVGDPDPVAYIQAMKDMVANHNSQEIKNKVLNGLETAAELTWDNAMSQIIRISEET